MTNSPVRITLAQLPEDFPAIQTIRRTVFQVEQGVDAALEFDGQDDQAVHWLAWLDDRPIGTARLRWLTAEVVKVERVAVLGEFRGQGIGKAIMYTVLNFLKQHAVTEVRIHAQAPVRQFYEHLGFIAEGDPFEEAGIPHIKMRRGVEECNG